MSRSTLTRLLLCGLLTVAVSARGMERITLSNGFTVDCHHRGTAADGSIRLFLREDESSYLDVDASRIRSTETLQEPSRAAAVPVVEAPAHVIPLPSASVEHLLAEQGEVHHLNVDLLKSVVQAESGGHIRAVSRTGAQGLMQLMPGTAKALGVTDSFAPDQNLRGGTTYLDRLLVRYHDDLALALAAYNAGPGAVDRYHGVPPYRETQAYVARIIREFNRRTLLAQRAALAQVSVAK